MPRSEESHGVPGETSCPTLSNILQGGAPQVISLFISPLTIDISTISPSY